MNNELLDGFRVGMKSNITDVNYNFNFLKDGTANNIINDGNDSKIERAVGFPKVYSQEHIVAKIINEFNSDNLQKGTFIEFDDKFKFLFTYKSLDEKNKIVLHSITINISKKILGSKSCFNNLRTLQNVCYGVNVNEQLYKKSLEREKERKREQKFKIIKEGIAIGLIATAAMSSVYFILYQTNQAIKEQNEKQQEIIDEINETRKEKGIPPIGLLDETGKQYQTWEDYYHDIKLNQQNDNSSEEEIEPLFEETGPVL